MLCAPCLSKSQRLRGYGHNALQLQAHNVLLNGEEERAQQLGALAKLADEADAKAPAWLTKDRAAEASFNTSHWRASRNNRTIYVCKGEPGLCVKAKKAITVMDAKVPLPLRGVMVLGEAANVDTDSKWCVSPGIRDLGIACTLAGPIACINAGCRECANVGFTVEHHTWQHQGTELADEERQLAPQMDQVWS